MDVKAGDVVFIKGLGSGQVVRLLPGGAGFTVRVGCTERTFDMDGSLGGGADRKVFWHDPFLVEPCRDSETWEAFKRVVTTLYDEFPRLS
jgi:hypothetical protein